MSAVAIGVGVSAAAAVASSQMQKSAAGKAAKAQGKASQKAAQTQEMWARYANQVAEENLKKNKAEDQGYTDISRGDLSPYAQAGGSALNQLMGLIQPRKAQDAVAASGTDPADAARRTAEWNDISQKYDAGQKAIVDAKAQLDSIASQGYSAQTAPAIMQAQQAYVNAQKNVEAINSDYWNKKAQFTGIQKYTPAQAAISAVEAQKNEDNSMTRKFNARDYILDPTTGGKPPPDLTKNFDQNAWLKAQGKTAADLTKNFSTADYLKSIGKTQNDLTGNFDSAGYLAKGGKKEGDLFRDFTMADYQADPGYAFRLEQGNKAINDSAAFGGGLLSGATQKAIADYNSGAASQEYGNAFNRFGQQQQTAQNAQQTAFNQFGQNRENLNRNVNTNFDMFGSNRQNLQQQAQQAFGNYNVDRGNASDVYQNAYSRWSDQNQNIFNRLQSIISGGQNASTNQAGYVQNQANRAQDYNTGYNNTQQNNFQRISGGNANDQMNQGNIQANKYAANANANSQMIQGIGNAISSAAGSYANSNYQNGIINGMQNKGQGGMVSGGGNLSGQIGNYLNRR